MAITQEEADGTKSYLKVEEVAETEIYSVQWTIPNWKEFIMNKALVDGQKITLESSRYGKWIFGLKTVGNRGSNGYEVLMYWKLVEIYGNSKQLQVTYCSHHFHPQGVEYVTNEEKMMLVLNEVVAAEGCLDVLTTSNEDDPFISSDGSVKFSLKLIAKVTASNKRKMFTEEFSKKSMKKFCENQANLLKDYENAKLIIITKDKTTIRAHEAILMAQWPFFARKFATKSRNCSYRVMELDDISGKTMKILLQYFYTGILLPTWSDEDTILEFVYAAGKYELNLVLELLNNTLGLDHQRRTSFVDVQLLNLIEKLSLKGAECRLVQRVVEKIKNAKESKELFELFGFSTEHVAKMASLMGRESILEMMQTFLGDQENYEQEEGIGKLWFQGLALVQLMNENGKMKKLEKALINRYGEIVDKFTSAKQLFDFFGRENL